eukprot:6481071-Amphidinium_carterae.1
MPSMGESLGLRSSRELLTIARAVDSMLRGDTVAAAECLLQRFKAVELSAQEGTWTNARHLEVIPEQKVAASSGAERRHAHACEKSESKTRPGSQGMVTGGPAFRGQKGDKGVSSG